ncbi:MAG TPA: hypothetical protein VIX59_13655 [Candidatus Binataceae bacterium]
MVRPDTKLRKATLYTLIAVGVALFALGCNEIFDDWPQIQFALMSGLGGVGLAALGAFLLKERTF